MSVLYWEVTLYDGSKRVKYRRTFETEAGAERDRDRLARLYGSEFVVMREVLES